jgi:hypothetical protein
MPLSFRRTNEIHSVHLTWYIFRSYVGLSESGTYWTRVQTKYAPRIRRRTKSLGTQSSHRLRLQKGTLNCHWVSPKTFRKISRPNLSHNSKNSKFPITCCISRPYQYFCCSWLSWDAVGLLSISGRNCEFARKLSSFDFPSFRQHRAASWLEKILSRNEGFAVLSTTALCVVREGDNRHKWWVSLVPPSVTYWRSEG